MSWHSPRQIELTGQATQVYPFGIFSSTIISGLNPQGKLIETVGFGTAINSFFLPGCIIGGLLMDKIGRRQTMTLGFVLWSILGFVTGGVVFPIMKILPLFIVLYGIFNGLGEMGPGVSDEPYPMHFGTNRSPLTDTFSCSGRHFPLHRRVLSHPSTRPFPRPCGSGRKVRSCYWYGSFHPHPRIFFTGE
jgi:MFS family permease